MLQEFFTISHASPVVHEHLCACCSILVVSITDHFLWQDYGFRMLVASFGASAVLLYSVPESKLAQPRNLIGAQCTPQMNTHAVEQFFLLHSNEGACR
jgi:CBS-domain-containing membrane protein